MCRWKKSTPAVAAEAASPAVSVASEAEGEDPGSWDTRGWCWWEWWEWWEYAAAGTTPVTCYA